MAEYDPRGSAGQDAGSSEDSAGAAFEHATGSTAEFLKRAAEHAKPIADLGPQNMEALVISAKLAGRASQRLTREVTEYARKSFEDAFTLAKSFAEVRSPAELVRIQSQFAKTAIHNAVAFSRNASETLTKTAEEVAASSSADPSGPRER